jgi:hypothetical protein
MLANFQIRLRQLNQNQPTQEQFGMLNKLEISLLSNQILENIYLDVPIVGQKELYSQMQFLFI